MNGPALPIKSIRYTWVNPQLIRCGFTFLKPYSRSKRYTNT